MACFNVFGVDGPGPSLPEDDPGFLVAASSVSEWPLAWNPKTGRLIVPAHTGGLHSGQPVYPISFSILSVNPETRASETLATENEGSGLRDPDVADTTGEVFYSFADQANVIRTRRVVGGNPSEAVTPAKALVDGLVLVSVDGGVLVTRSGFNPSEITITSTSTGALVRTIPNFNPTALSPDGSELLDGFSRQVVRIPDGAVRSLGVSGVSAGARIMDARWTDGSLSVLLVAAGEAGGNVVTTWSEASGATDTLGVVTGEFFAFVSCARLLPDGESAVVVVDSVFTGLFSDVTETHSRINVVSGGNSRSIGSVNRSEEEGIGACQVSPDGKWFAYRRWPGATFLKPIN